MLKEVIGFIIIVSEALPAEILGEGGINSDTQRKNYWIPPPARYT
jgi:hypothetical protein